MEPPTVALLPADRSRTADTVPDRPSSIKRIYTDYDFDLAISNQANPSEPVPTTTQYYTTDGIAKLADLGLAGTAAPAGHRGARHARLCGTHR